MGSWVCDIDLNWARWSVLLASQHWPRVLFPYLFDKYITLQTVFITALLLFARFSCPAVTAYAFTSFEFGG